MPAGTLLDDRPDPDCLLARARMDFQPDSVSFDGPRLWFSNNGSKYLWSWTAATGLTRHTVHIPNAPGTAMKAVVYYLKGPCV